MRFQGSGFRILGLGYSVQGVVFRAQGNLGGVGVSDLCVGNEKTKLWLSNMSDSLLEVLVQITRLFRNILTKVYSTCFVVVMSVSFMVASREWSNGPYGSPYVL